MLVSLHVKNVALIRETEVELGPGLNILTGETGAGKSLIIGSVNIALGTGSFKDYVPEGTEYSLVELVFETGSPGVLQKLEQAMIPVENGQVILSRKYQKGRSISRVNGESVSGAFIRELASDLIDIHGQHEHQSLLYPRFHLELLDRFAGKKMERELEECRQLYREHTQIREELEKALLDEKDRAKQMDLTAYEIREIEEAALRPGEDEELEKRYRFLSGAQKIESSLGEAKELISGTDGASEQISRAVRCILSVSSLGEQLEELGREASQLEDLAAGLSRDIYACLEDMSFDEQEYYQMEQRLDLINHLKTKYGRTIEEILSYRDQQCVKLERLTDYEAYLEDIRAREKRSKAALEECADRISTMRHEAALRLEQKIKAALEDLNFPNVRFRIGFETLEKPAANGRDAVCFLLATNPGMPLRPLQDTASGGELSRVMLAIKSVMADQDEVETLIFDEIDTGISGRTAQKVSEKMAVIAGHHQVICITHLAQIAAMADSHYEIIKETDGTDTVTSVHLLDDMQSCEELARILGGARITEAVRTNAREMKAMAEELKKQRNNHM